MDEVLTLDDGRRLGWSVFGDPAGRPVVALHGSPDSRLIWSAADVAARRLGVWLIAPDRPGFGLSDPDPGRSVLDWVRDHRTITTHLGLDRHALIAISGGSPYATAVAFSEPTSVTCLGLLSVISPLHAPGVLAGTNWKVGLTFRLARRAPALLGPMAKAMVRLTDKNPGAAERRLIGTRPPADRSVISRPDMLEVLRANLPNQFKDPTSIALEMRLAARDWGFALSDIAVPTIIWQGGLDDVHTPAMARYLQAQIPGARLEFEPDYATFNWFDRFDEILGTLI